MTPQPEHSRLIEAFRTELETNRHDHSITNSALAYRLYVVMNLAGYEPFDLHGTTND